MARLPRQLHLPFLLAAAGVLVCALAWGMLLLWDLLGPRPPYPPRPPTEEEMRRRQETEQRMKVPIRNPDIAADPLAGRRFPARDASDLCRQRIAAYRQLYRKDDWACNYYMALWIVRGREARRLHATRGATAWIPSAEPEARELGELVDHMARLAHTADEKELAGLLEKRAFEAPE